jgi:hypothetical protein
MRFLCALFFWSSVLVSCIVTLTYVCCFLPSRTVVTPHTNNITVPRTLVGANCASECMCSTAGVSGYGRYCGYGYSGCSQQPPCDAIDACCMAHDFCVDRYGYLSCACARPFVKCQSCGRHGKLSMFTRGWTCPHAREAATTLMSDITFCQSRCFDPELMLCS